MPLNPDGPLLNVKVPRRSPVSVPPIITNPEASTCRRLMRPVTDSPSKVGILNSAPSVKAVTAASDLRSSSATRPLAISVRLPPVVLSLEPANDAGGDQS
jgi:hypothetical protein